MLSDKFIKAVTDGSPSSTVKDLGDGTYVMSKALMFHWTLIRGQIDDWTGYFDRWCYGTREQAEKALHDFPLEPPAGYEPVGWHRHPTSGRRRPDGNPDLEYVEP